MGIHSGHPRTRRGLSACTSVGVLASDVPSCGAHVRQRTQEEYASVRRRASGQPEAFTCPSVWLQQRSYFASGIDVLHVVQVPHPGHMTTDNESSVGSNRRLVPDPAQHNSLCAGGWSQTTPSHNHMSFVSDGWDEVQPTPVKREQDHPVKRELAGAALSSTKRPRLVAVKREVSAPSSSSTACVREADEFAVHFRAHRCKTCDKCTYAWVWPLRGP